MMDRVMLMFLAILYWTTQGFGSTEVEEDKLTRIPYVTSAKQPNIRYWYRGHGYDENNPPKRTDLLFTLIPGSDWTKGPAAHEDMSADPSDFSLTISKTRLEDNGFFTCKTFDRNTTTDIYDVAGELQVYIQPVVKIDRDGEDEFGKDLKVTCTVPRLFPTVTADDFKMNWTGPPIIPTFTENNIDGDQYAKKYTLSGTRRLEKGIQTVSCTLTPKTGLGQPASKELVINITDMPTLNLNVGGNQGDAYMEGEVNVSCTLTDGQPAVVLSSFKIDWGNLKYDSWVNTTGPTDNYNSYKIEKKVTLTTADEEKVVSCNAKLADGTELAPPSAQKTLHVWRPPPKHDLSDGAIAGIVIGSMAGGGLIGAGIVFGIMKTTKN